MSPTMLTYFVFHPSVQFPRHSPVDRKTVRYYSFATSWINILFSPSRGPQSLSISFLQQISKRFHFLYSILYNPCIDHRKCKKWWICFFTAHHYLTNRILFQSLNSSEHVVNIFFSVPISWKLSSIILYSCVIFLVSFNVYIGLLRFPLSKYSGGLYNYSLIFKVTKKEYVFKWLYSESEESNSNLGQRLK